MPPQHPATHQPPEGNAPGEDTTESVPCHLCGTATRLRPVATRGQHGLPARVSICRGCGLVLLSPRWTKARYDQFYASGYDAHYGRDDGASRRAVATRLADAVWERLRPHVSGDATAVLDVGAGHGWGLARLRERMGAKRADAIEPSENCRRTIASAAGCRVIATDAHAHWHRGREATYDVVVLRHTLEHMLDPVAVLGRVAATLTPDGRAYVAVPNMMRPRTSLRHHWFRAVHTYYFSAATLEATAALAGLRAVEVHDDGGELWAVFARGSPTRPQRSVYRAQMRVLRFAKLRDRTVTPVRRALRSLAARVRAWRAKHGRGPVE